MGISGYASIDLRDLNHAIVLDHVQLPTAEEGMSKWQELRYSQPLIKVQGIGRSKLMMKVRNCLFLILLSVDSSLTAY